MTLGKFGESRMFAIQEKAFNTFRKLLVFGLQPVNSSQVCHLFRTLPLKANFCTAVYLNMLLLLSYPQWST